MSAKRKKFRAIDLYSGIGGWTLGLELAGIDVIASYEIWSPAIETHKANFNSNVVNNNIRKLDLSTLPKDIDFVVGSPPCTKFSYSNRGGAGDIDDGLKDLSAFLKVIKHLNPKYWAMENVPRVKKILDKLLLDDPHFMGFANLFNYNEVVKCAEYGIPQNRKRMIAGRFPHQVLEKLKANLSEISMGECLENLNASSPNDLIYDIRIDREMLTGVENEDFLNHEELRMNRESKTFHPVYNVMSFPDRMNAPSRTITSTCTRVSRESIVINSGNGYRRLNLRERALLQGFPIQFKFLGNSYADQLKMVGNAIPPPLTYLIASCMLDKEEDEIVNIKELKYKSSKNEFSHIDYNPNTKVKRYPENRTFKFCIPHLRFGSGVRFQLSNKDDKNEISWETEFYYGNSKEIIKLKLRDQFVKIVETLQDANLIAKLGRVKDEVIEFSSKLDFDNLQAVWNHSSKGKSPFHVVDFLGEKVNSTVKILKNYDKDVINDIVFDNIFEESSAQQTNQAKFKKYALYLLSGLFVCSAFNSVAK
jgi:DNA (cytosine-5)-methyltransferase 1